MGTGNDLARVLGWGVKYVGDEHEIEELLYDFENADRVPCLLYTSPSPRDKRQSRMPSSA